MTPKFLTTLKIIISYPLSSRAAKVKRENTALKVRIPVIPSFYIELEVLLIVTGYGKNSL